MINSNILVSVQEQSDEESSDSSERTDISSSDGSESVEEVKRYRLSDSDTVRKWLGIVTFTICATAALVMISTYVFLSNQEDANFEAAFITSANSIADGVWFRSRTLALALQSRANSVTSHAVHEGSHWPFLTIPHFATMGRDYRLESGADIFGFAPVVPEKDRAPWEQYSYKNSQYLLMEEMAWADENTGDDVVTEERISDQIFTYNENGTERVPVEGPGPYVPFWQSSPQIPGFINFDLLSSPKMKDQVSSVISSSHYMVTEILFRPDLSVYKHSIHDAMSELERLVAQESGSSTSSTGVTINHTHTGNHSHTVLFEPVYRSFQSTKSEEVGGVIFAFVVWDYFFSNLLPEGENGIQIILENTCNQVYSYQIDGPQVTFLGPGDHHDDNYQILETSMEIPWLPEDSDEPQIFPNMCTYSIRIFPTDANRELHSTNRPETFTAFIGLLFLFMLGVFYIYVKVVHRRQEKLMETAARTSAIVSSLFPANVRDRIMREAEQQAAKGADGDTADPKNLLRGTVHDAARSMVNLKSGEHMEDSPEQRMTRAKPSVGGVYGTKPIADLFPEATVLFADMVGFTAWSSIREPTQVFELLETIYHSFDKIAKKRRVFKVETIGDCYVAVTGLPEPRKDHAIAMAYFANDCLRKMQVLTRSLEISLGPDTGDLTMRFGLHSGSVTAGVLRGAKSRFQLFGDTVNTAARMESNGLKNKIHVSHTTANLLNEGGKSHWVTPREDKILAKGKGEMQTYWVSIRSTDSLSASEHSREGKLGGDYDGGASTTSISMSEHGGAEDGLRVNDKFQRLVEWNVDQLLGLLEKVIAKRNKRRSVANPLPEDQDLRAKSNIIDEIVDVIPAGDMGGTGPLVRSSKSFVDNSDDASVELDEQVVNELHDYVESIATFYRNNPFHNFSHASHVAMSVMKLIHRIVSDADDMDDGDGSFSASIADDITRPFEMQDIVSDPLTQFALVLAALVHDVEHSGIPNSQLVKENSKMAQIYCGKSIHEQSSVDLAFEVLMDEQYTTLRNTIYRTESEFNRFRQIMINSVMATDVLDPVIIDRHSDRWELAFKQRESSLRESFTSMTNRKATVLIEHMIQASDVSHSMQHWHVYRKWNELLFQETYLAFKAGRAEDDPSDTWYESELDFFDSFVIPLATKLTESGAFGYSCDEYLTYAQSNREEWQSKGKIEIEAMVERVKDLDVEETRPNTSTSEEGDDDDGFDGFDFDDDLDDDDFSAA